MDQPRRVALGLFLLFFGLAIASPAADLQAERDALRKQLQETELEVEKLRREVPPSSDSVKLENSVKERARAAGLGGIDVTPVAGNERLSLPDGRPSPVELCRMDISGRAPFDRVQLLLDSIARLPRIIDFENLRLEAASNSTVSFKTRLVWACWNDQTSAMPPSPPAAQSLTTLERQALVTMQSIRKSLLDLKDRFHPARFTGALGAFDEALSDEAVALTAFRADGETVIEGFTLGASAAAALKPALEKAGFSIAKLQVTPAGDCRSFSIIATLSGEPAPRLSNGLFDDQAPANCSPPPAPALNRITVKDSALAPNALTLHLRDVDIADVFRVLDELTSESFLVDPDVQGSVSVDAEGAALEKILASMSGLIIGPGPLRVVRRAEGHSPGHPLHETSYSGEPVNLSLKDAGMNDVLCLFTEMHSLKFFVPPKLQRRVTIFVRNMPWDRVLDTMISSAGLSYRIDKDHVVIGSEGSVEACEALDLRRPWWRLKPAKLAPQDLKLAGLANAAGGWKAYAYIPGRPRMMLTLEPGTKLLDAEVSAVGPSGVTFQTASHQAISISLRP